MVSTKSEVGDLEMQSQSRFNRCRCCCHHVWTSRTMRAALRISVPPAHVDVRPWSFARCRASPTRQHLRMRAYGMMNALCLRTHATTRQTLTVKFGQQTEQIELNVCAHTRTITNDYLKKKQSHMHAHLHARTQSLTNRQCQWRERDQSFSQSVDLKVTLLACVCDDRAGTYW